MAGGDDPVTASAVGRDEIAQRPAVEKGHVARDEEDRHGMGRFGDL